MTPQEIRIHTTATNQKDGTKVIPADEKVTIVDAVKMTGLSVGKKYKLKGWEMVKAEKAKLLVDGKEVRNDLTFKADKESMTVEITFTFDASELQGKKLVTFEELYDVSGSGKPKLVAEHKDIKDKDQTVTVKSSGTIRTSTKTGLDQGKSVRGPKTGDSTRILLYVGMLLAAGAALTVIAYRRRKVTDEE